jgi:hypothetical protein
MIEHVWKANPKWKDLPEACEGDIVQLKYTSGFSYLVKIIVTSVKGTKVAGVVEAVFDWNGQGQVTGGVPHELVNKELTFEKNMMQKVIKRL